MSNEGKTTQGVENLLGAPREAVLKTSLPMMLGMFVQSIYNVVDGFWVAGLGADELAAIGLFFPFFMLILSVGSGLGAGGSSAVSRRIGADDREGANSVADHTVVLGVLSAVTLSALLFPFLKTIFPAISGSARVAELTLEYARILVPGAVFMVLSHLFNALLRGEGAAKRGMWVLVIGAVLNGGLDPFFIYTLDLGITGAAVSTVFAMFVSTSIYLYWYLISRDTYVELFRSKFRYVKNVVKDIMSVGLPSAVSHLSISATVIILNLIVLSAAGNDGVAVLTSGWRITTLGIIPLVGMSAGLTAVAGASYGQKKPDKLKEAYSYSLGLGFLVEAVILTLVLFFAPLIAKLFTYSPEASRIYPELVVYLRRTVFMVLAIPFSMFTSAVFRGIGKGFHSLAVTAMRTVVFQTIFAYLLGPALGNGLTGVWWGIVTGNFVAGALAYIWGTLTVNSLSRKIK